MKELRLLDLGEITYHNIYHIGDIHGCYTVLKEFMDSYYCPNNLYIFTGDYLDRGIENVETLEYISALRHKKNIIFIEGNHDRSIREWVLGEPLSSGGFRRDTCPQLENARVSKEESREFVETFIHAVIYTYGDKRVLVSHGGLERFPETPREIEAITYIHGEGAFDNNVDAIFTKEEPSGYQVHGHRNRHKVEILDYERSFNLEGKVEYGNRLRVLRLDEVGFHGLYLSNSVFNKELKKS